MYNFRRGLLQRLVSEGAQVSVLAPRDDCSDLLRALGCQVIDLEMSARGVSPRADLQLMQNYREHLRRLRPELLVTYTIKPNIFGVLAAHRMGIPTLAVTTGLGYTFINENFVAKTARFLYRRAFRYPLQVWFLNEEDRKSFLSFKLVQAERAVTLPGEGIDLQHFQPKPPAQAYAGFRFLLIARMLWDKGVGEYVEAARLLKATHPGVEFQLLGQLGANNPSAVSNTQMDSWSKDGLVTYLGVSTDVRPWIAAADCVVLPSYREGIPRTLMEAAAMEKPLIATNVPGCRDVVADGVNGLLCRVRDAGDLAEKMRQMLDMPRNRRSAMGFASRRYMAERFDEQTVINRYMEFFTAHGWRREVAGDQSS